MQSVCVCVCYHWDSKNIIEVVPKWQNTELFLWKCWKMFTLFLSKLYRLYIFNLTVQNKFDITFIWKNNYFSQLFLDTLEDIYIFYSNIRFLHQIFQQFLDRSNLLNRLYVRFRTEETSYKPWFRNILWFMTHSMYIQRYLIIQEHLKPNIFMKSPFCA